MYNPDILLLLGWCFCIAIYGYIFSYAYRSGEGSLSVMLVPLLAGIIFENWRLSADWRALNIKLVISLLISLTAFIPGKTEDVYIFENHIQFWQYSFLFFFVASSVFFHADRTVLRIGEGTTLIQTMAVLYLCFSRNWYESPSSFDIVLLSLLCLASIYVFFHAFSSTKLTKKHRLVLSLCSSIIMVIFASDHMTRVLMGYPSEAILNTANFLMAIDYFLLGIALIYIFRNISMLWDYLPSKNNFYGKYHRKRIQNINKLHISRYDSSQLQIKNASFIVIFSGSVFYLNYIFNFFPDHTLIWMQFWILPFIMRANNDNWLKIRRKNYSRSVIRSGER